MTGNIVARRYAKALFSVGQAKGKKDLQEYGSDLAGLVGVLESTPGALKLLKNPIISVAEKKNLMAKLLASLKLGPMVSNFLNVLADNDRLAHVPAISQSYSELLDESQGVVRGTLVTAMEVDKKRQEELKKKLEKQVGRKLILGYSTDPDILGGLMLRVGDKVLDASLRAQLNILKDNIKRGE